MIERNTYRLLKLVDDLLDLARLEAGNLELTPSPVNIELCLQEVLAALRPQLAQRPGALRVAVDPRLPRASGNVLWLRRALNRVLSYTLQTHTGGTISLHASAAPGEPAPHGFAVRSRLPGSMPSQPTRSWPAARAVFHPRRPASRRPRPPRKSGWRSASARSTRWAGSSRPSASTGRGSSLLLLRGARRLETLPPSPLPCQGRGNPFWYLQAGA